MAFRRSALAEGPGSAPDPNGVELVPMRRRHLRRVLAIEEAAFTRPWSIGVYLSELALPATRVYLVAKARSRVVGYAGCMLVAGEAHVTTIAVAPDMHRRGIGTRLLLRLLGEARARGAGHATLEVRESNHGAQDLYREFGFAPVGIRKNYYSEVNEDAVVMWAHDIDSEIYGERLERIEARLGRHAGTGGPSPADGVPPPAGAQG
jgi:ribosomal-protein-alanine N-acetyltransferase